MDKPASHPEADSAAAPEQKPPRRPRRSGLRGIAHVLKILLVGCIRLAIVLFLLLVVLIVYLHWAGVPRSVLDSVEDAARARGFPLHIRSMRLQGGHGVVASGVELALEEDSVTPLVHADEVAVWLNPLERVLGHGWKPTGEIRGGRVRATLGGADDSPARDVAIDDIGGRATLDLAADAVQLRDFSATAFGARLQGRGEVTHLSVLRDAEAPPRDIGGLELLRNALASAPPAVAESLERLQRLEFADPPQASLYFAFDATAPRDASAEVRLEAPTGGHIGLWQFSAFAARARWKDRVLDIRDLELAVGEDTLEASARWDLAAGIAQASLSSTLPPAAVMPLLRDEWQQSLSEFVEPLDFPVNLKANCGPAPLEELPTKLHASLHLWDTAVSGIPIQSVEAQVSRDGPEWRAPRLLVRLRNGRRIETLIAEDARYSADNASFSARFDTKLTPTLLLKLPWCAKGTLPENLLSRFKFAQPVACRGAVRGTLSPLDWDLRARATAQNVILHGESVESAEADLALTPTELRVTSILMTRPEGTARGEVALAFRDKLLHLDVDTTFAPRAICKLLGPVIEDFASRFAMEGPCRSQLRGAVDLHNFSLTSLDGHADGDLLGFGPFVADHASADVAVRGKRIMVSNAQGTLWGGSVSGDFAVYPIPSAGVWHFETDARGQKVQLAKFLANTLENPNSDIRGNLSFNGHLAGDLSPAWADSLLGEADVRVADGLLLQMRLLSGLTFFLKIILPGIDLFSQTDASGHFRVANGVVRTDDASISGALFGVRGEGSYRLDNHLDFEVEVKLLHRGFIATIVQFVTSPLTRLLKFRLEGSLQDPSWSAINLNPMRLVRWATSDSDKTQPPALAAPLPVPDTPDTAPVPDSAP